MEPVFSVAREHHGGDPNSTRSTSCSLAVPSGTQVMARVDERASW
jgi:hypothetical protein